MTAFQLVLTALFAVFWTGFMIWWSGDTGTANIVILSLIGILVAASWAFVMKRFGHWRA